MPLNLTVAPPAGTPTFQGYVDAAVAAAVAKILGGATPATDTLKELADALAAQADAAAATYLAKTAAAKVATTGAYSDLAGKPTIPTTATQVGAEPAGLSAATSAAIGSQIASAVAGVVAGAPAALDTLLEIAQQLATDESAASALAAVVATKQTAAQVAAAIAAQATSDAATYAALDGTGRLTIAGQQLSPAAIGVASGVALDSDGVPYYLPSGTVPIALDADGVPYIAA